jgi:hypothetical protein
MQCSWRLSGDASLRRKSVSQISRSSCGGTDREGFLLHSESMFGANALLPCADSRNGGSAMILAKSGSELAAEDTAECANGQEETVRRSDPSRAIGSKSASGNNVMDVGMMLKVLPPGMQHAKKSSLCSQMLRVTGKFEQCRCAGSEEQIVKQSVVPQPDRTRPQTSRAQPDSW